jgi:hypothetical protein
MAASKKRPDASGGRRQGGAALLILVMLMGIGAATLLVSALSHNNQERRRIQLTIARLAQAQDALVGFAATNGRLPRPAVSATDGHESPQPCVAEEDCSGFLPWVTLGVDGSDAWDKLLRYSVTPIFTTAPVLRISAIATKTVQTRYSDGQLAYTAGQDNCTLGAQCAPLVLLSHGKNNFGTSVLGVPQLNTARGNADELLNAIGSVHFVSRPASDDPALPGGEFDDLVSTVPLAYLYKQMAAAHRLP